MTKLKTKKIIFGILSVTAIAGLIFNIANGAKKESIIKPEVKQIKAEVKEKKTDAPKSMLYFSAGKTGNDIKQKEITPQKADYNSYSYSCKD